VPGLQSGSGLTDESPRHAAVRSAKEKKLTSPLSKALVRQAVALNSSGKSKPSKKAKF
jgi:hypothetical protein